MATAQIVAGFFILKYQRHDTEKYKKTHILKSGAAQWGRKANS
jgi:hypothetical protein